MVLGYLRSSGNFHQYQFESNYPPTSRFGKKGNHKSYPKFGPLKLQKIKNSFGEACYLLPPNDSARLSLDYHVFVAPKMQAYWRKCSWLIKIFHDIFYLIRFKLYEKKKSIITMDQNFELSSTAT